MVIMRLTQDVHEALEGDRDKACNRRAVEHR